LASTVARPSNILCRTIHQFHCEGSCTINESAQSSGMQSSLHIHEFHPAAVKAQWVS